MLDKIKRWLLASFISNAVRKALGWSGSALVTAEILTKFEAATWEEITYKVGVGVALIAVDAAWSYFEKKALKASFPIK